MAQTQMALTGVSVICCLRVWTSSENGHEGGVSLDDSFVRVGKMASVGVSQDSVDSNSHVRLSWLHSNMVGAVHHFGVQMNGIFWFALHSSRDDRYDL